jgi:hypothetical protein
MRQVTLTTLAIAAIALVAYLVVGVGMGYGTGERAEMVSRMQIESLEDTANGCRIKTCSGRTYDAEVSCSVIVERAYSSIFVELE